MYPDEIAPLMDTCLFGEVKNVANDLNIQDQTDSLTQLYESSKNFIADSEIKAKNVWDDYLVKISQWMVSPSLIRFTVPENNPNIK